MLFTGARHPLAPYVAETRDLLGDLRELLARRGEQPERLATLRQALADLDHLFLLVVAGEFNAGKSALINALLGEPVLAEGVTPTTAAVTLVTYSEQPETVERSDGLLEVRYPLPLLRDVALVDTPGTNAILRQHEQLTREFIPRSDLLLFVTSADRPFTESERAFLEQVRAWGKKIVVVLNKVDLLADPAELEAQLAFIRESAQRLLGLNPPILPFSARLARAARVEPDQAQRQELMVSSGLDALTTFLETTLDESGRLQLKLQSALGVAERLLRDERELVDRRLAMLRADRQAAEAIEQHLRQYADDQRREFAFRLDRLDNLLHDLTVRGERFFEQTIRIGRVFDLLNADKVRADFERQVVADAPDRIDDLARELIDWMVDEDQRLWHWVTGEVQRRAEAAPEAWRGRLELPFANDRRAVLQELLRTTRDVLRRHDHRGEAEQLAASVRDAVTRTGLVEAGALGLGAITVAVVGSVAADITGLLAAAVIAGLGFYLLPLKRRRLSEQLRERTGELRETLATALGREFETSLSSSIGRVQSALAPYDRFVHDEQVRLEADTRTIEGLEGRLAALRARIGSAGRSLDGLAAAEPGQNGPREEP